MTLGSRGRRLTQGPHFDRSRVFIGSQLAKPIAFVVVPRSLGRHRAPSWDWHWTCYGLLGENKLEIHSTSTAPGSVDIL
jgi:hypothetical protein